MNGKFFVSTAGCVAMYLVMEAIPDPGDEVLIFDPYFSAYATQVRLGGGVPVFVPCREADGWQPDMERAAQYLTPRTKALVINTPNNPTGVLFPTDAGGGGALCPEERPAGGGG